MTAKKFTSNRVVLISKNGNFAWGPFTFQEAEEYLKANPNSQWVKAVLCFTPNSSVAAP